MNWKSGDNGNLIPPIGYWRHWFDDLSSLLCECVIQHSMTVSLPKLISIIYDTMEKRELKQIQADLDWKFRKSLRQKKEKWTTKRVLRKNGEVSNKLILNLRIM